MLGHAPRALASRPTVLRHYYTGPLVPLDQIKQEFAAFDGSGGRLDFVRDDRSGIGRLTLNSPKACNALSGSMMVQLADIVDDLSRGGWPGGRGLILAAAKNSANIFCAGGDLNTVRQIGTHEQGFKMSVLMNHVTRQLRSLPLVTVALVDGSAVGGGAELVSSTDHRLVTSDSHVTFVQARMGLCTGFGGSAALVSLIGYTKALDFLVSGRKLNPEEGRQLGYYDAAVSAANPLGECEEWLERRLAVTPPEVLRTIKAVLRHAADTPGTGETFPGEFECRKFAELWSGEANRRALEANIKHK